MKKRKEGSYKEVTNTLKKRYLPAVILITLIILIEQIMIHNQLANCESMSHIMNEAGRQRMLSQRITKDALLLSRSLDFSFESNYLLDMKESVATLEQVQTKLLDGKQESDLSGSKHNKIIIMFIEVQKNYEILLNTSKELIQLFEDNAVDPTMLEQKITLLLTHEEPYLTGMDLIVSQYEQEYAQEIDRIQNTKSVLFLILILIIGFELAFLFMPATRFLARIFREINEAHENIIKVFQNVHEALIIIEKEDYKVVMMSNLAKEYFLNQTTDVTIDDMNLYLNQNWSSVRSILQSKEELVNMEITLEIAKEESKIFLLSTGRETFQSREVIIVTLFDITNQKKAEESFRKIAIIDELTGLYNRHFLDTMIVDELERSKRYNYPMSLIILDLDHFKRVNDTWGHPVGDLVLKQTAEIVTKSIRRSDYLIRFGGEEFLILMPHTNWKDAMIVAEKIRHAIEVHPHPIAGYYTASLGLVQRGQEESFQCMYEHADAALYRAKNEGRNRVAMYDVSIDLKQSLLSLEWNLEWNSGDIRIDDQHKKLISFANEIISLSHSSTENQREEDLISLLIQQISQHFEYEESILKSTDYEDYIAHTMVHKKLLEKVEKLEKSYHNQEVGIHVFLTYLIEELVIGHLFDADTKFFPYLREKLSDKEV